MTADQLDTFQRLVLKIEPDEFHHGDRIGADREAHYSVRLYLPDTFVWIWPPEDDKKRAYCETNPLEDADRLYDGAGWISARVGWKCPYPYLTRNRYIVHHATHLIATPAEYHEVQRSGTWSTIRAARRIYMPTFIIIWPNGRVKREN